MSSMYQLTSEYMELLGHLEECQTPEETSEIVERIAAVNECIGEKAESYARIIQGKSCESEGYAVEIRRLQGRKSAVDALIDRLKAQLLSTMQEANASELSTSIGTWKVRANPESVVVLDPALIPPEFLKPQPAKIDKRAMLAAHRETGEIFPGVEFVQAARVEFR